MIHFSFNIRPTLQQKTSMKENQREELLKHLAASLHDAKKEGGAILLVGAGISVSAGIPPAQKLMKIAIENFPDYFTKEEKQLLKEEPSKLQYNDIMTKLSASQRKTLFNWHIKGDEKNNIPKAKLNFAHLAIAELLKQKYIKRILTTNFDPLLINACYMVGMYPLPSIYDLGSVNQINPELFDDPCIIYLNGQHAGQVQRNTPSQLTQHKFILSKVIHSTGCKRPWIIAGYSGENDPLMEALDELRPYNNWLYWLEYNSQISKNRSHHFLELDEECKVINQCDADETFMEIAELLQCSLDFIERPEVELQNYLNEINFNTALTKGEKYKSQTERLVRVLSNKLDDYTRVDIFYTMLEKLENDEFNDTNLSLKIACQKEILIYEPQNLDIAEKALNTIMHLSRSTTNINLKFNILREHSDLLILLEPLKLELNILNAFIYFLIHLAFVEKNPVEKSNRINSIQQILPIIKNNLDTLTLLEFYALIKNFSAFESTLSKAAEDCLDPYELAELKECISNSIIINEIQRSSKFTPIIQNIFKLKID